MEVHGLDQSSFLNKWATSGADTNIIKYKNYFVFELQGFFAFSEKENDGMVMKQLKEKVKFLVDDAPALAGVVNPNAPIQSTNLHFEYSKLIKSKAKELLPLIQCGKNLTRIPVLQMNFGDNKGKVIVSQLLTKDRLYNKSISPFYKAAEDETAKQLIFNMIYLLGQ